MLTLNFKTFGQGPAIIILHGLFGSLDNWHGIAKRLSESYSVYIIDQRNHGKSPHVDDFSYAMLAEDLHDFMDQHGIYEAHLVGHSMGGKVVMQFANLYPERIDKLVVADMAPKRYKPHHTEIFRAMHDLDLESLQNRREAADFLSARLDSQAIVQFLLKNLGREGQAFRWKFNLNSLSENYKEILDQIEMDFSFDKPTLFLSGERSDYVESSDHDLILELFTEASFEVLPDAGHWLHADSPAAFLDRLTQFLAN